MTYLIASELPELPAGTRLRALLQRTGLLSMPGVQRSERAASQAERL